jgi:hypothetical protein
MGIYLLLLSRQRHNRQRNHRLSALSSKKGRSGATHQQHDNAMQPTLPPLHIDRRRQNA